METVITALIGFTVGLAFPKVLSTKSISRPTRTLAKSAIRGYLVVTDQVKALASRTSKDLSEIVAEVHAELEGTGEKHLEPAIARTGA